jgi:hypothetical protein
MCRLRCERRRRTSFREAVAFRRSSRRSRCTHFFSTSRRSRCSHKRPSQPPIRTLATSARATRAKGLTGTFPSLLLEESERTRARAARQPPEAVAGPNGKDGLPLDGCAMTTNADGRHALHPLPTSSPPLEYFGSTLPIFMTRSDFSRPPGSQAPHRGDLRLLTALSPLGALLIAMSPIASLVG